MKNFVRTLNLLNCSNIVIIQIFKEFEIFLWKKDAFDCAGIRAQVFRLPVFQTQLINSNNSIKSETESNI